MKKKYGIACIFIMGVYGAFCLGQEFIKSPKAKKVYVSCQQYLELEGEVIVCINSVIGTCSDLLKAAFLVQKDSLGTVNDHVDGQKECFLQQAGKVERTHKYTKLMKIKQEWERCADELCAMKQRLEAVIADYNA